MTESVQGETRGWPGRKEGRCGSKPLQCVTGRPRAGPTTCLKGLPELLFSASASVSRAAPTCLVTCSVCLNLLSTSLPFLSLLHYPCSPVCPPALLRKIFVIFVICSSVFVYVCCFHVPLHYIYLFFCYPRFFFLFLSSLFTPNLPSTPLPFFLTLPHFIILELVTFVEQQLRKKLRLTFSHKCWKKKWTA